MKPPDSLPPELVGHSIDRTLCGRYRRRACLGCLAVPVFFLIALHYLAKEQALPAILYGIVSVVFLGMYIYRQQFKKHEMCCQSCRQKMVPVDSFVPKEKLNKFLDGVDKEIFTQYITSFAAPDGKTYMVSRDSDSADISFYRLVQRWYACHHCGIAFLAEPRINLPIKEFRDRDAAEAYRQVLIDGKDPEASDS
jgi:hypothetical protein